MRRPAVRFALLVLAIASLAGCGREEPTRRPVALPVDVFSDTARDLRIAPPAAPRFPAATDLALPRASAWLARVSPAPAPGLEPALVPSEPDAGPWPVPPVLAVDEGLKPPIPRGAARLAMPRGAAPGWVELDVRVDEDGAVSDVEWAGGAADSARVEAATAYAFAMRWFPALQAGRPVAVWCRQRVDFGR